jgi:hypothetical protein
MLTGAHAIIYSSNAEADRAFLRDVLLTEVTLPGGGKLGVYQPRHQRPA